VGEGASPKDGTLADAEIRGIADAPGETWKGVDRALRYGRRGIKGGSSLYRRIRGR